MQVVIKIIQREIAWGFKVSKKRVHAIQKTFATTGNVFSAKKTGRQRILDQRNERKTVRESLNNPKLTDM